MNDFVEKYSTVFKSAGAIAALAGAVTVLYSQLSTQDNVADIKREIQMTNQNVNTLQLMILDVVLSNQDEKLELLSDKVISMDRVQKHLGSHVNRLASEK